MNDRPQYPTYPGDDDPKPSAPPAGPPVYGQEPARPAPPAAPGYGQVPPPGYGHAPRPAGSSTKAIWGLVLGIISMVFCYLGVLIGPAAIIVSVLARRDIDARPPGALSGRGMATAGLVTGIIGTVFWGAVSLLIGIGLTAP